MIFYYVGLCFIFLPQIISQSESQRIVNIATVPMGMNQDEIKCVMLKLKSDHKLKDDSNMRALLKTPNTFRHDTGRLSPTWKSCRYNVYHNQGIVVKEAIDPNR